jgi:hypothetical protein
LAPVITPIFALSQTLPGSILVMPRARRGMAVVLPVVLYPFSYTIWFATELLMDPPSDEWLARAAETILQIPASNA